ncbi:GntR family transcriptional regulator [Clostridium carboxidivorans P7]|uniref:Transcriptional regulator, GntR family n=1 Tax=Clostridium carboxidivorans P7 TaxID=536227 RepID=C6Q003_9CLOT|nr:GntR family transcriptional regulator [Clostridium carboxidivorans]AKN32136.1 GntR family transcriptional regulator [Clostridium carboxidivorans P7]EET85177.1 transcriptional regulator, GntR family [Clostridium carboxidivorans P7]
MLIKIDFESDTPIYVQLKREIIQGIAKGELKEGDSLPSVRQMAEDIGINMHTVNKAYNMLKIDGFITIDRRKGAIINKMLKTYSEEYMENLSEELRYIIAEAYCRGVDKKNFLNISEEIFKEYT